MFGYSIVLFNSPSQQCFGDVTQRSPKGEERCVTSHETLEGFCQGWKGRWGRKGGTCTTFGYRQLMGSPGPCGDKIAIPCEGQRSGYNR